MGKDDVVNEVAIVSPAASILEVVERGSGFASPIGSHSSRSPSPVGSKVGPASPRGEILLTIPISPQATPVIQSPASVLGLQNMGSPTFPAHPPATLSQPSARIPRPFVQTSLSNPTDSNPSNLPVNAPAADSTSSSRQSSPNTTTVEQFPPFFSSGQLTPQYVPTNALSPAASPSSIPSHPPSPGHLPKKRLSFVSYNDLLSFTPTTTQPLSSLTTCASAADPPPHIPGVSGLNIVSAVDSSGCTSTASRAPSLRNFSLGTVGTGPVAVSSHLGKRDSIALLDNIGGEWEREGLGKGLDERLDELVLSSPTSTIALGGKA